VEEETYVTDEEEEDLAPARARLPSENMNLFHQAKVCLPPSLSPPLPSFSFKQRCASHHRSHSHPFLLPSRGARPTIASHTTTPPHTHTHARTV
jgi:hypothetical protein